MSPNRKRTWRDLSDTERFRELCWKTSEMLAGLTPHERACMLKVHMAEADRKPIDPVAKRVVDDAVERFNAAWRRELEVYGVRARNEGGV